MLDKWKGSENLSAQHVPKLSVIVVIQTKLFFFIFIQCIPLIGPMSKSYSKNNSYKSELDTNLHKQYLHLDFNGTYVKWDPRPGTLGETQDL